MKEGLGIAVTTDNQEVVKKAEVVVLSVKPQFYAAVIEEIREVVSEGQIIVTIAPGQTLEHLQELFGKPVKIVRTMPNTPALVGEGITGVCKNELVTEEELSYICKIFSGFGKAEVLSEKLMDGCCVCKRKFSGICLFIHRGDGRMRLSQMECRERRHINLQRRQFMGVRKWCWRQENIQEN